ncbi:MAG: hypothetical protein K2N63_17405, partial [Lachnospiraceae bacterium]|nr:hypothetical protein [Lachnospiraceae bacterium]
GEEDLADQVKNQYSGMSQEDIGETQEKEECAGQEKTMQDGQDSQNEEDNTEVKEREAGRLKTKVCAFIKKLLHLYEKVREILRGITEKISAGKIKVSRIKACAQMVFDFLRDEENKNGIKYTGKSILRLLKHVFPYRIEGDIVFATGDAYSEGRVLSVLGLLYPLYGRRLKISADFTADAFRLEGQLKIKGRVRLGTILWIAFRLWRKGKIMRLISAAKELKHKLMTSAL